ncbi:MAG TPA: hypothetical protein VFQ61_17150 [Polyangiaceae bacterium]|nr:hypothetical protein [Polyangiaceae bacterium]
MNDPKRLIHESNALGVALAGARRQVPSARQLSELAQRLSQAGAPVGFEHGSFEQGSSENGSLRPRSSEPDAAGRGTNQPEAYDSATRPTAVEKSFPWGKWALGVVGGAGTLAALWVGTGRSPIGNPVSGAAKTVVSAAPSATELPRGVPEDRLPNPELENPTQASGKAGSSVPLRSVQRDRMPEASTPTQVEGPATTHTAPSSSNSAPPPRAAEPANSRARAVPSVNVAPGRGFEGSEPTGKEAVLSEIELLKRARAELSGDPLRAYVLTETCRTQYPRGAFAQEREFIAITALSKVGREQEARSRASLFRSHFPRSAYLKQLAPLFEAP